MTDPGRTVIDCAKKRPCDEALAVADSALRNGDVTRAELMRLAEEVPTTGRTSCLRVAREADGRADNPFESVLRAISHRPAAGTRTGSSPGSGRLERSRTESCPSFGPQDRSEVSPTAAPGIGPP